MVFTFASAVVAGLLTATAGLAVLAAVLSRSTFASSGPTLVVYKQRQHITQTDHLHVIHIHPRKLRFILPLQQHEVPVGSMVNIKGCELSDRDI